MNRRSVLTRGAGAILLFFALDTAVFRTGYYASILEPNSTAGFLQSTLWVEQHRQGGGPNEVLAVGDSRIPLKPGLADAAATGYSFFTIAVPGTTPRCWYYMLRAADPGAQRYAAIVIPVDTYDDRNWEDLRGRELDLRYLAPLVGFRDLFGFALSYPEWADRGRAAATVLFKGMIYREDFQDFLVHHKWRMVQARDMQSHQSGWRYDIAWANESLDGLSVDWAAGVVRLPAHLSAEKRKNVEEILLREPPPRTAEFIDYRRRWFGKILERYRGSRTRIVFVRLARGPAVRPGLTSDATSTIREFGVRGDALLVGEHFFDPLERPELFGDALHMNQQGATEFSGILAREVARILHGMGALMLFHTTAFFVFLAVVLPLFYLAPRRWGNAILLAASYYFYMSWNARFVVLLWVLTAIDYTAAIWMSRFPAATAGRRRKMWLTVSLSANLGFLGFFKYFNFLTGNAFALHIILPMGISFHTFQSMSYVIDVYRGEQEPVRNVVDYALYIAFFPQLVAGPIVRARHFFADLYHWRAPSTKEQLRGILLVVFGLVKKVAVADQFARVADLYFKDPASHPGALAAWSGAAAFSMQIYFDFSGYTDIAIGLAQLFGFHFPENFRRPYLAHSITDFWRRWHISLSTWLRDYLYIPLGGNRHGRLRTYRNLMLTMLLGGLWHGASWNFVVWGGYHGALLSAERALGRLNSTVVTFLLATIGWVFFRAATFSQSLYVFQQMMSFTAGVALWPRWEFWLAAGLAVLAICEERYGWFARLEEAPAWVWSAAVALLLFGLETLGVPGEAVPFVYFQF